MLEVCFRKVVKLIHSAKHVSCYLTTLLNQISKFVSSPFEWKLIHLLKYCSG